MKLGYAIAAFFCLTHFGLAQATSDPVTAPPAPVALKLSDATPVVLRTKASVSSENAVVGDRVPFRVTEDVKVGDLLAISRGTDAWGVVTAVQHKARKGHPGTVDIAIQSVQLVTNQPAPLRADQHLKGEGGSMGRDMGSTLAETRGIGAPLLPLMLLEKGKDAVLPANTKVTAYVNGEVIFDRAALEHAQPPIVHRTGPATVTIYRGGYGPLNAPSIYCGKIAVTRLPANRYLKLQLPAGTYSFASADGQPLSLKLEEGQEAYLWVQMLFHGMGTRWHIVQVGNSEGEDSLPGLKELNNKQVVKLSDTKLADWQAPFQKQ